MGTGAEGVVGLVGVGVASRGIFAGVVGHSGRKWGLQGVLNIFPLEVGGKRVHIFAVSALVVQMVGADHSSLILICKYN